jgi:2-succinyl-5-enolpyruvyl-6-hydroxy-3-cyclohexene-1-carboxylate synthase
MIVLTADRPRRLVGTGSNQTINQYNIFNNYVNKFIDFSHIKNFDQETIINIAINSYKKSISHSKGPVHINIPFNLPLHINDRSKIQIHKDKLLKFDLNNNVKNQYKMPDFKKYFKPIIICTNDKNLDIVSTAKKYNIPIFMECRGSRFSDKYDNIISSYEFILNYNDINPDLILRFGDKPISNVLNKFLDQRKDVIYLITQSAFNDDAKNIIECKTSIFLEEFNKYEFKYDIIWLNTFIDKQNKIKKYINNFFNIPIEHEGYIINKIISILPSNSNLMIGNSSPIRDLDKFTFNNASKINVFSNRGASGIDGIISTSIGLSINQEKYNFLILGDISFFYDMSALMNHAQISINLNIIILNNGGGHIFDRLEGLSKEKNYSKYWLTPLNLDIKDIAKVFQCNYLKLNYKSLSSKDASIFSDKGISLIEVEVNSSNHQLEEKAINSGLKKELV